MLKMTFTEKPVPAEGEEVLENTTVDMTLLDENNFPTPLLIGLVALELAFDLTLACILAKKVFNK